MTTTDISTLRAQQATARVAVPPVRAGFFDTESYELTLRVAKAFAASSLVPREYQGSIPNCMIALNLAQRMNADPLMVMQNLVIVHGRPTWSAQYLIATVNVSGRFSAIRYEFFGERGTDEWGCRAWAVERGQDGDGEKLVGAEITIAIAKREGWYGKNGSKWQSIPQQMLMYRAGSWWVRAYAPELSMGLMTADEAGDVFNASPDGSGGYAVDIDAMRHKPPADPAQVDAAARLDAEQDSALREVEQQSVAAMLLAEPEPPATKVADFQFQPCDDAVPTEVAQPPIIRRRGNPVAME